MGQIVESHLEIGGIEQPLAHLAAGLRERRPDRVGFADDVVLPAYLGAEVAEAMPNARYLEIPDAGHLGFIEKPDAVNKAALEVLAEIDGKPYRWAPPPPAHD